MLRRVATSLETAGILRIAAALVGTDLAAGAINAVLAGLEALPEFMKALPHNANAA